jgi:hypothetical protein
MPHYCQEPNCISKKTGKQTCATYGYPGQSREYCFKHKKDNMVNLKTSVSYLCKEKNCISEKTGQRTNATYGYPGNVREYCEKHKKDYMVNLKDKKCADKNCNKIPSFNFPNMITAIYCCEHKKLGMEDIKSQKCIETNCNARAIFNFEGLKSRLYCSKHKKEGMLITGIARCKTPLCNIHVQEKYKGYCYRCYHYMFPDDPISRNYKTKENELVKYIKENFGNFDWCFDKIITGGCSSRRPDCLLDLGSHVVIVEIDENQHTDYDTTCENRRLMELSQDIAHRPMIMIRFNPDSYINSDNKKISSCWCVSKTGKCEIKNFDDWLCRLNILGNEIEKWIEIGCNLDKTVEVVSLFYDEIKVDNNIDEESVEYDEETLSKYKVKELKDLCKSKGIVGYSKKKKDELIEMLL